MLKKIILLFMGVFLMKISNTQAQTTKYLAEDYKNKPLWIDMMEDTTANYYEAIKAFDIYWVGRLKPMEEEDIISEIMSKKEEHEREKNERKIAKLKPAQRAEFDRMKYETKRFENWKREVFPFVQESGRILTPYERQEIWKKQQIEIENQK